MDISPWEGTFVAQEAKTEDFLQPYVYLTGDMYWRAGPDQYASTAVYGEYTLSGGRIEAREWKKLNGPVYDETSLELKVLEPHMLIVTKVSGEAAAYYHLEAGDVLVHTETSTTNAYKEMSEAATITEGIYRSKETWTAYVTTDDNCREISIRPYIQIMKGMKWSAGQDSLLSYHVEGEYTQEGDRLLLRQRTGVSLPVEEEIFAELQILSDKEIKVVRLGEKAVSLPLSEGAIFLLRGSVEDSAADP